jgi:aminoglycoside phosphotransferase (APT) family kinase protein
MARRAQRRLDPVECEGHPALRAWRELGGSDPPAVLVVKEERGSARQSRIYRLEGVGPGGASVVAKRSGRETIALERRIYAEVLAGLPIEALCCFGTVDDADPRFAWLFLEAARGEEFDADSAAHRASAATWLAGLHTGAEALPVIGDLPDRGPDHFLDHLRGARRRIAENFDAPALRGADRGLLDAILCGLDVVEWHWSAVEEACAGAPQTLVHGDFAKRNVRVESDGSHARLWVFDWEVAGRGAPGIDLVRADADTYAAGVRERWPGLDVPLQSRIGRLLRGCLAPIGWESLSLGTRWIEEAMRNLASYRRRLDRLLADAGWVAGGTRRGHRAEGGAAERDCAPEDHPAARAWRRLGRSDSGLAEVACLRRKPGSRVFRLRGVGSSGSVVAKRTSGAAGEVERRVYEHVLPRLPVPSLAFHGAVAEDDGCWLFLEDAGAERVEGAEARELLTAWLARFHTSAAPLCSTLALPERAADQYRDRLRDTRRTLHDRLGNPALSPADRWVLRELAGLLERLDARWHELEELLGQMPRTLVHGDLGAPNLRVRRDAAGAEVLALDWETASVGPPAIDLFAVEPALYAALVSREWPGATPEVVARWKRCGQILRGVAATEWETSGLAFPWVEKPMAGLRIYRRELEEALAGLEPGGAADAAPGGGP